MRLDNLLIRITVRGLVLLCFTAGGRQQVGQLQTKRVIGQNENSPGVSSVRLVHTAGPKTRADPIYVHRIN